MTTSEIITKIFDGTCMLFLGSGFSFGAQNSNPQDPMFKGARTLADMLLREAGYTSTTNDLRKASSAYLKRKSPEELVTRLKEEFQATCISTAHDAIGRYNWYRIYTTNYDNIIELSYSKASKTLIPITLSSPHKGKDDYRQHCIHLNGYIGSLTPEKLENEFKLTSASYLTDDFSKSEWFEMFKSDIVACDALIFIGFSMDYDLDLARIIVSETIKDKALFIVKQGEDELDVSNLSDFGTVVDWGLDEFVKMVQNKEKEYTPPLTKLFTPISFHKASIDRKAPTLRDIDFYKLILNGDIDDHLAFHSLINNNSYPYLIHRSQLLECVKTIEEGVHSLLIESALGNGKSIFLNELAILLTKSGKTVFIYDRYTARATSEISTICEQYPSSIVIFDDYHTSREQIKTLRQYSKDICIVTSERRSLHEVIFDEIENVLGIDYKVIKIDKLSDNEIIALDKLLDKYSLWRDLSASTDREKYIKIDCERELCRVILSRVKSPFLTGKIKKTISEFSKNKSFEDAFKFLMIAECFHIRFSIMDLATWVGADLLNKPSFKRNQTINEFIDIQNTNIKFKSSVVARYILTTLYSPRDIIDILIQLVKRLATTANISKENKMRLITFVNFTTIQSCLNPEDNKWKDEIFRFYETIKDCSFCMKNIDFWLQYAIARLHNRDYVLSKMLFDKCYSLANDNHSYKTYRIDNHYCRFLLENEIDEGAIGTCMEAFRHAHEILSNTHPGDEKKHYPFKVVGLYKKFYDRYKGKLSAKEIKEFKHSCLEMIEKCQSYMNSDNCTNFRVVQDTKYKLELIISES
jgi:hypothetical protein